MPPKYGLFIITILIVLIGGIFFYSVYSSPSTDMNRLEFDGKLNDGKLGALDLSTKLPMEITSDLSDTSNGVKVLLTSRNENVYKNIHLYSTFNFQNGECLILSPPHEFRYTTQRSFKFSSNLINIVHTLTHENVNINFISLNSLTDVCTNSFLNLLLNIIEIIDKFQQSVGGEFSNCIAFTGTEKTLVDMSNHLKIFTTDQFKLVETTKIVTLLQRNMLYNLQKHTTKLQNLQYTPISIFALLKDIHTIDKNKKHASATDYNALADSDKKIMSETINLNTATKFLSQKIFANDFPPITPYNNFLLNLRRFSPFN